MRYNYSRGRRGCAHGIAASSTLCSPKPLTGAEMDDAKAALRRASLTATHVLYNSRRRNFGETPTSETAEAYVQQLFSSNAFEQVCAHVDRLVSLNHSHVSERLLELRGRSLLRLSEYMLALEDFRQILRSMNSEHLEARAYYKVSAKMTARHCLLKARRIKEGIRTPLGHANPTAMEFPSTHSASETPLALSEKVLKLYTLGLSFAEQLLGGYICDFTTHPDVGSPQHGNWGGTGYGQGVEGSVGESLSTGSAAPDEVWQLILAARIGRVIELLCLDRTSQATTELAICRQLAVHLEDGMSGSEYNAATSAGGSPSFSQASLSSMGNFDSVQSFESRGNSFSPSTVSQPAFFEDSQEPDDSKESDQAALPATPGSPYLRRSHASSAVVLDQPRDRTADVLSTGVLLRAHFDCLLLQGDNHGAQGDFARAGEMWAAAVELLPKPALAGTPTPGLSAIAALQESADTETFLQETDTDMTVDPFSKAVAYHNHGVALMRLQRAEEATKVFSSVLVILENRVGPIAGMDPASQAAKIAYKSMLCQGIALLTLGVGAAPLDPSGTISLDNVRELIVRAHVQLLSADELSSDEDMILHYALGIAQFCIGDETSAHKRLKAVANSSSVTEQMQESARQLVEATTEMIEVKQRQIAAAKSESQTPAGDESESPVGIGADAPTSTQDETERTIEAPDEDATDPPSNDEGTTMQGVGELPGETTAL